MTTIDTSIQWDFFQYRGNPKYFEGEEVLQHQSSCPSAGRDWSVMFIFPMGGRDMAVVIVDIVSIVDWLNPWRRLEGGPVSA
jgi:hypothetical protein